MSFALESCAVLSDISNEDKLIVKTSSDTDFERHLELIKFDTGFTFVCNTEKIASKSATFTLDLFESKKPRRMQLVNRVCQPVHKHLFPFQSNAFCTSIKI